MKKLVVLLMAMLVASTALAVAETDPDGIGVYFDTTADLWCTQVGASTPFMAYVIITNPTIPVLSFYEFGYSMNAGGMEASIFRLADFAVPGSGANGIDIGSGTAALGDHIVGLDVGIPTAPAVVVHSWQLMLLAPMQVEIFLGPSSAPSLPDGWPTMLNDVNKEFSNVYPVSGGLEVPVALINPAGDCVVSVEESSFGSVKSLYR